MMNKKEIGNLIMKLNPKKYKTIASKARTRRNPRHARGEATLGATLTY